MSESNEPRYYMQPVYAMVVGVTEKNADGINRQEVLKKCREGQEIHLVSDPDNPHDKDAVKVCIDSGDQIGWLSKEDVEELSEFMKGFEFAEASIAKIVGETSDKPTLDCIIEIRFYRPLTDEDKTIEKQPE